MEDRQSKIVTMSDGAQVYLEDTPDMTMTITNDDTEVESVQQIDVDEKQRTQIIKKLATHEVCYDEISGQVTFTPRKAK